ncbi:MAG: cardiolipin synthase [Proteobacteria bacterium]|nr:cardiolipin synthase [Pseudomonadota bacterium]
MEPSLWAVLGGVVAVMRVLGFVAAGYALLTARTSQGAIAWSLSLVMAPELMLPIYLIFGERKFHGYVDARREGSLPLQKLAAEVGEKYVPAVKAQFQPGEVDHSVLEKLARMPFTGQNNGRLLVDGEATFDAILAGIAAAREYVLVQFFIIKDDGLGRALQASLIQKACEGVRIHVLYDAIGSHTLPSAYVAALLEAGIEVEAFRGRSRGKGRIFQLNFRNHRKIVVVDGHTAYVGGHNVGDEYLGKNPVLGHWRDTHVELRGPAALGAQLAFMEDWYWMTQKVPPLQWKPEIAVTPGQRVLALPSGPADELDTCELLFTELIQTARQRIWIVSPYFVPDQTVVSALQLAALRGVDVRIMLPEEADHKLVYLAKFTYLEETLPYGIRVFSYQPGFLHQKVVLVDDDLAAVGTANLDNRSFRLNFEITLLFADRNFAGEVAAMLATDFSHCREMSMAEIEQRPIWFKVASKIARLLSPIL